MPYIYMPYVYHKWQQNACTRLDAHADNLRSRLETARDSTLTHTHDAFTEILGNMCIDGNVLDIVSF